jgi:hypothetical protein
LRASATSSDQASTALLSGELGAGDLIAGAFFLSLAMLGAPGHAAAV